MPWLGGKGGNAPGLRGAREGGAGASGGTERGAGSGAAGRRVSSADVADADSDCTLGNFSRKEGDPSVW